MTILFTIHYFIIIIILFCENLKNIKKKKKKKKKIAFQFIYIPYYHFGQK